MNQKKKHKLVANKQHNKRTLPTGLQAVAQNSGSRYWWGVSEEAAEENPRAYIEIKRLVWTDEESGEENVSIPDQALLTEEEIASLASELPEDWVYPPDPMAEDNDEDSDDEDDADEEDPPLAD